MKLIVGGYYVDCEGSVHKITSAAAMQIMLGIAAILFSASAYVA